MRTILLFIILILSSMMTINSQENKKDYLKKVLGNLEKIETATFRVLKQVWEPGDTVPNLSVFNIVEEYVNPKDTTLGASWVSYTEEKKELNGCYDGHVYISYWHDKHGVVVDDFAFRKLPFRPMQPPFFTFTKNIIQYALTTNDSISVIVKDCGNEYLFRLVISEEEQVEFFGRAYHIPKPPFDLLSDPTSVYEIWISKSNDLPYKVRREMCHSISAETCSEVGLNSLTTKGINAMDYIPKGYEVREYGKKYDTKPKQDLVNKQAPDWTLMDIKEQMVSLSELKSKVVLIEFTGIGCGPCMASIPFLNELKNKYSAADLTVVGIETWNRKTRSLQNYANRHAIGYTFLSGNDEIVDNYQVGLAAPAFFILDENRIIRKIVRGYSPENTRKEISNLINELLKSGS